MSAVAPPGFPAYFWRHKQPFVAWFCAHADADAFLAAHEELENLAAVDPESGDQLLADYVNVGHYHCMAESCPEGGDDE